MLLKAATKNKKCANCNVDYILQDDKIHGQQIESPKQPLMHHVEL